MFRYLVVLALGLGVALPVGAAAGSIEEFVETEMTASGVPGLAYAVVADGQITSVGAQGVARLGTNRNVTPDTPFAIGSISKSFTALAVMQLVEAGEVDLDASVSGYLDGFTDRPAGAITIRQLLNHTSGFSTVQGNTSRTDEIGGEDELARSVDGLADVDPAHPPGERWEYSNTNYQILGRLIEVVSGQEYQTYVEVNILEPVGMKDSFVGDGEIHEEMATGHRPWFGTKRPLAQNATDRGTAPQGGVVASVNDLALYMMMFMNGEDDVLSAEGKTQMMQPADELWPFYGFGWYLDADDQTVWHSGLTPGVETLLTMVPSEQRGVVVLVNANGGIGFGETAQLHNGVTAMALDLDYDGEGSPWSRQALYLGLILGPVIYLLSMVWAWRHREEIRAKTGFPGLFSLWFPLLTTLVAAWVILWVMPNLFGAPLGTLILFQPDFGLAMIATAVFGVFWAVFRLGVAFSGKSGRAAGSEAGRAS